MLEFFVPDGFPYRVCQYVVRGVRADDSTKIGLFSRKEAGAQLPIGSEADAITSRTERLTYRIYKTNFTYTVTKSITPCGLCRIAGRDGDKWAILGLDNGFQFCSA